MRILLFVGDRCLHRHSLDCGCAGTPEFFRHVDARRGCGPVKSRSRRPGFGPQITIWHDGNTFTVTRISSGGGATVTHALDGRETRSQTPGRLCEGDSQSVWTAGWQDSAVVTTLVGAVPPGATAATKMDVKAAFRAPTADTMTVELTFVRPARPNHGSYRRRTRRVDRPRASRQRWLPQPRRRSVKSSGLPERGSAPAARPRSKNAGPLRGAARCWPLRVRSATGS